MDTGYRQEIIELRKRVLGQEFSKMNEMQKKAVFQVNGPLLILAGAGSGKTTVLVNRIANIIEYGDAYHSDELYQPLTPDQETEARNYANGEGEISPETKRALAVSPAQPWQILAITFTNKAAGELKERLTAMLGQRGEDIWASTFHSTCARMLRRDGERICLLYTSRCV